MLGEPSIDDLVGIGKDAFLKQFKDELYQGKELADTLFVARHPNIREFCRMVTELIVRQEDYESDPDQVVDVVHRSFLFGHYLASWVTDAGISFGEFYEHERSDEVGRKICDVSRLYLQANGNVRSVAEEILPHFVQHDPESLEIAEVGCGLSLVHIEMYRLEQERLAFIDAEYEELLRSSDPDDTTE